MSDPENQKEFMAVLSKPDSIVLAHPDVWDSLSMAKDSFQRFFGKHVTEGRIFISDLLEDGYLGVLKGDSFGVLFERNGSESKIARIKRGVETGRL